MMSWWVPQVVGTLVSTQKAQMQKVEKVRYGKVSYHLSLCNQSHGRMLLKLA